ncbi:MAG: hypothetical protein E6J53_06200 [Chloroflexi bacterium]|nr:MAG: hypothetical protein E6J53_06200 [Chloroflexota bacterium]
MQLENSFGVKAPPDTVFAFLLDPYNLVGCVPGAELTEQVDAVTFKGRLRVKVGPISVGYSGTGRLVGRNDAERTAVLEGEADETTGTGSGHGTATITVAPASHGGGSLVRVVTEFTLTGRVAQLGSGVIEEVARRMVREVSARMQSNLETMHLAVHGMPAAPPVNAASVVLSVLWERLRSLLSAQPR